VSQKMCFVSIIKTSWLMNFKETLTVYSENHVTHKYSLVQNAKFSNVKTGGAYSNHCVLKG
jgi:hypothetical protein